MEKNVGKLYLISTILLLLTSAATAVELYYDNGPAGADNCMMIGPEGISRVMVRFTPNVSGTVETIRVLWTNQCSEGNQTSPVDVTLCECVADGIQDCVDVPSVHVTNVVSGDFQDINVSSLNFNAIEDEDFCVQIEPSQSGGDRIYIARSGNATYLDRYYNEGIFEPESEWNSFSYLKGYLPNISELAVRAVISGEEESCHWNGEGCSGSCNTCTLVGYDASEEEGICECRDPYACRWYQGEGCYGSCSSGECVDTASGDDVYCNCQSSTTTTTRSITTTTQARGGGGGGGGGSLGGSNRPTCYDYIKNCHDSEIGNTSQFLCETDIDCGGPCDPCVSCSDGIQNQGELGIDCGGSCAPCPVVGGTTTTMATITEAESTSTTTTTTMAATTTTQFEAPGATGFAIGSDLGGMSIFLFLLFLLLIVIYIYRGNIFGGKK